MAITKEQKAEIVTKFGKSGSDTGTPEVQIALLTARINDLTPHFEKFAKDHHSRVGLLKMVGKRNSLLKYLTHTDRERYQKIITKLLARVNPGALPGANCQTPTANSESSPVLVR